jgi:hypothetical protein
LHFEFCIFSDELCLYVPITSQGGLDMLIAQGLGEYGALAGGGSSGGLGAVLDNIQYTIRDAEPTTWIYVCVGLLVLWFVFLRK